jgi:phosphate transport system protein
MTTGHRTSALDKAITRIRQQMIGMAKVVQAMTITSIEAFLTTDKDLAFETIRRDDQVDQLEIDLDNTCIDCFSQCQPEGKDVRFMAVAMKQVTDLERIADLSVNICEKTIELDDNTSFHTRIGIQPMAQEAIRMLHDAVTAFISEDQSLAEDIFRREQIIDAYHTQVYRQLLDLMTSNSHSISAATRVQAVVNNIERIADHTTNIAERVIFITTGRDIRHQKRRGRSPRQAPSGILFLCVHNSARSQMAEAIARETLPQSVAVYSAGSNPAEQIHPTAVEAMLKLGIDISWQKTKKISHVPLGKVDMVITLCSDEICMNLPSHIRRLSWPMPDPAEVSGSEQEILAAFVDTCRQLKEHIEQLAREFYPSRR